ncbi:MAG: hypothetical protein C4583_00375 [Anaerolineaceae bacterium]|nr:MAG: hypothetical protein C4583_00375 [Anaerolineaceae bacterium]
MDNSRSLFGRFHTLILIVIFVAAIGIRLYDLTDLPLDFHPTRQLFSALKARGMYYETLPNAPAEQREFAIQQGKLRATIEPEIIERLTVFTWKFTGEQLWVARIYSSLFWLIGGIFIYLLARDIFSRDAALFTIAFYLLLHYAVIASRSFQPDPLMVALILGFWWAVNRWAKNIGMEHNSELTAKHAKNAKKELNLGDLRGSNWFLVILASLLGGVAIFVKLNAAFFVIGGALGAMLGRASLRDLLRNKQVWTMAALGILPGLGWVVYGLSRGFLGQQFGGRFMPELFLLPNFYLGWAGMLDNVLGLFTFALALLGLLLVDSKPTRSFLLGLWGAYLAFAIFFDYHISTHDYYSLPLIPIAALTLTPLADAILVRMTEAAERSRVTRVLAASILTFCLLAALWTSRVALKSADYRPQAAFWNQIGETVRGHRVVALTQDYGLPLAYWGWTGAANWPDSSDIEYHALRGGGQTFEKYFDRLTKNKDIFLVTDLADLKRQPDLQTRLSEFAIFAEGDGYIIYDLQTSR